MSHGTGSVVTQNPAFAINPNGGPGNYQFTFSPPASPEQGGTKLLILHFTDVDLPAGSTLEVDLGYDKDVFTSAAGSDFWTRPVDVYASPGGVPITLVAATGAAKATIDKYGRGERHPAVLPGHTSYSNCDPFLKDATYTEPTYDPFWYGVDPPEWDNVRAIPVGDIRRDIAASVGMIMHVDGDHLSTCTVTLVAPDMVITAGHCMTNLIEDARTGSVFFGYQTEANGDRLPNYEPIVVKCTEVVAQRWDGAQDYCLVRLAVPAGGLGVPIRQMRHDLPAIGEQVFGVHHPNGAVMKVSAPKAAPLATVTGIAGSYVAVSSHFDVTGGTSGSALFDMAGRVIGVLSHGDPEGRSGQPTPLLYSSTSSMLAELEQPPAPPVAKDVALVIDKSGSMSLPGTSGRPKIAEAHDAASLFVQLVRAGTGSKIAVVSFDSTASVNAALADVTPAYKTTLVGGPPYTGGAIGAIVPGSSTSIGAGLIAAEGQLNVPDPAPKSILLLTDGLQNTQPWIAAAEGGLGTTALHAIGYGTPGSLDGTVLNALASAHSGQYVRADSNLRLEKFFAQAFGSIFESGLLQDPEYFLKQDQPEGATMPFTVCGEEAVTVVVGWDNENADLALTITMPNGQIVVPGGDVVTDAGRTWAFIRVPLPHLGERDGTWKATVVRPGRGSGEFRETRGPACTYFLSVIAAGGPQLRRLPQPARHYTGDPIRPAVHLGYDGGGSPEDATIQLDIVGPDRSAGTFLSEQKLTGPRTIDGDTVPSRQATLLSAEEAGSAPIGDAAKLTVPMSNAPAATGYFEAGGVYAAHLPDLLTVDGDYTFHASAIYGDGCTARREVFWSLHAEVGIDPDATEVEVATTGPGRGEVTFTPQDRFGNRVGPGAGDRFDVTPVRGASLDGSPVDNGDGSYTVPVSWDPNGTFPGLTITQPGRPPVTVAQPSPSGGAGCLPWSLLLAMVAVVIVLLVLLLT